MGPRRIGAEMCWFSDMLLQFGTSGGALAQPSPPRRTQEHCVCGQVSGQIYIWTHLHMQSILGFLEAAAVPH
jgi:hypothetical protein